MLWKPTVKYLGDTLKKKANLMSTLFNKSTTTIPLSIDDNYNNEQKNQSFIKNFQFLYESTILCRYLHYYLHMSNLRKMFGYTFKKNSK